MAYDPLRFNENAAGMTAFGNLAVYDGQGPTSGDNPGGDPLGTIKTNGYFGNEVKAAIARSVDPSSQMARGPHENTGILCLLRGNNGQELSVLWDDNGTVKVRPAPTLLT